MSDARSVFLRALRTLAGVAALGLVAASCTALRLGYDHGDTLIVLWMDRYLDLTSSQERFVRASARALLAWHRATQLRDYANLLETVRARLEGPVTVSDVLEFNEAVNRRLVVLGDRAAPDLASLALMLAPGQIDRLERKMTEDTEKLRREFAGSDVEQSARRRSRQFQERAESWFGNLRPDQLELVRASFRSRGATDWAIEERVHRQSSLVALLRRVQADHPDSVAVTAWVRNYFIQIAQPTDPQEGAQLRRHRMDNATLIAELLNSADQAQRAKISRRLTGYVEDFNALARERSSALSRVNVNDVDSFLGA